MNDFVGYAIIGGIGIIVAIGLWGVLPGKASALAGKDGGATGGSATTESNGGKDPAPAFVAPVTAGTSKVIAMLKTTVDY